MTWGFVWLMLALKIPLLTLIGIVWWAIKKRPEEPPASEEGHGGGGSKLRHPHAPQPSPRLPRRGPHGGAPPPPPSRVRTVRARARTLNH